MNPSEFFGIVEKRLPLYLNPVTIQNLNALFYGFNLGYTLENESLQYHKVINVQIQIWQLRGWEVNALGPEKEMKKKGLTKPAATAEIIRIKIETWKFLKARFPVGRKPF
jgi:hypothetical protein